MSIDQQIVDIEALVAVDAEIKDLKQGIEQERGDIQGVRAEVEQLNARVGTDRSSVSEMDKTRGDLVQELRQISDQIDRSRDRMQRARNERESNAAEREMDELRKIQRDRDEEVKKLVALSDEAKKSIQDAEDRIGELSQRLEGSLAGKTKTIEDLEGKLADAQERRKAIAAKLPGLLFRRYESVAGRGRVPVAKSHDGTCLGCFVQLPPMLFHKLLSRTEFGECPQCHRIIYYAPKPSPEEEAAASASEEGASEEGAGDQASSEASS